MLCCAAMSAGWNGVKIETKSVDSLCGQPTVNAAIATTAKNQQPAGSTSERK